MRSSSLMKPTNNTDTPILKGVSKSKTTGFINDTLHQPDANYDSYEDTETASDHTVVDNRHLKRFSCFNFTACSQETYKNSQFKRNLIAKDCTDNSHPVHLRDHGRVFSSSGIFTKVRQRIVKLNRRSTPVSFDNHVNRESLTDAAVARSMTDYNIIELNNETGEEPQEENPLKKRKFGYAANTRFTKSPALYDIHLYTNEDPELQSKKISDLLEEKEEANSYDEYENDYENAAELDPDSENNFAYTTSQYNRFKHHSDSLASSTSSFSTSEHSYAQDKLIPPPVYPVKSDSLEVDSIIFIDDGQSEYVGTSTINTSGSQSLVVSSFRGSLNNISRLILKQQQVSDANNNYETESNQFLNEVNRKLARYVKNHPVVKSSSSRCFSKLQHSEKTVDIGRNYDEQFNDNISIFSNTRYSARKAPLADSESTTLSNSNDNLLNSNSLPQFRLFNTKYPLVSKLLMSHQYSTNN